MFHTEHTTHTYKTLIDYSAALHVYANSTENEVTNAMDISDMGI